MMLRKIFVIYTNCPMIDGATLINIDRGYHYSEFHTHIIHHPISTHEYLYIIFNIACESYEKKCNIYKYIYIYIYIFLSVYLVEDIQH